MFKRIVCLTGEDLVLNNVIENGYFPFLNMVDVIGNTVFYSVSIYTSLFSIFSINW